jgi:hypothetical protein
LSARTILPVPRPDTSLLRSILPPSETCPEPWICQRRQRPACPVVPSRQPPSDRGACRPGVSQCSCWLPTAAARRPTLTHPRGRALQAKHTEIRSFSQHRFCKDSVFLCRVGKRRRPFETNASPGGFDDIIRRTVVLALLIEKARGSPEPLPASAQFQDGSYWSPPQTPRRGTKAASFSSNSSGESLMPSVPSD